LLEHLTPSIAPLLQRRELEQVAYAVTTASREDLAPLEESLANPAAGRELLGLQGLELVEIVRQHAVLDVFRMQHPSCAQALLHTIPGLPLATPHSHGTCPEELIGAALRWGLQRENTRYTEPLLTAGAEMFTRAHGNDRAWFSEFLSLFPRHGLLTSERGHGAAEILMAAACDARAPNKIAEPVLRALDNLACYNLERLADNGMAPSFPFKPRVLSSARFGTLLTRMNGACPPNSLLRAFVQAKTPAALLDLIAARKITLPNEMYEEKILRLFAAHAELRDDERKRP